MTSLTERIDAFEQDYLSRLRQWSAMIAAEDLDTVTLMLEEIEPITLAITEAAVDAPEPIRARWRGVLDTARGLLTAVESHLIRVRGQSRGSLEALDRGRRTLDGYRNTMGRNDGDRLDSEG